MTMEQIKKDVVVVGGGPGGFAAAVTAARAGAQVLLLERNGYLVVSWEADFRFWHSGILRADRWWAVLPRNLWTGWSRREHPMDMNIARIISQLH